MSEVSRLLNKMTDEEKDKYEDELHALELLEEEVQDIRVRLAARLMADTAGANQWPQ